MKANARGENRRRERQWKNTNRQQSIPKSRVECRAVDSQTDSQEGEQRWTLANKLEVYEGKRREEVQRRWTLADIGGQ